MVDEDHSMSIGSLSQKQNIGEKSVLNRVYEYIKYEFLRSKRISSIE